MIKFFVLTFISWTLFVLFNTVGDAIDFYAVFPWYGNMDLWHFLKYFWIGFAVLTGIFAIRLWMRIKYDIFHRIPDNVAGFLFGERDTIYRKNKKYRLKSTLIFLFLLAWFIALRYSLHEALMWQWRNPLSPDSIIM